ncbi:MerR family transcriptional regulator [Microbacterium sp. MYb66]|uniref:helix-turn-helix domain-containing protein n=1 Tax=Microbacterium sp. MYb66 TaxID=1848692 RepID=UPI000CFF35DC|nr:MerR family transcriptional regulator [Microbacterium sp. MYb66]PRA82082.1 MerR family transcriptional regulator [Microbacterium sp. MYb66]
MSIGDVAQVMGLPTNVLRHWETVGLLRPERDSGGRRKYDEDQIVRIAVIQRSKGAGMTLEQIGVMLDDSARERHQVLQKHLDDIDRRMEDMLRSRAMTEHAMNCRSHDIATCSRFRAGVADVMARF